jgi:hypothetical protein
VAAVAAVAAIETASGTADFVLGDMETNVAFGAVGVERYLRPRLRCPDVEAFERRLPRGIMIRPVRTGISKLRLPLPSRREVHAGAMGIAT